MSPKFIIAVIGATVGLLVLGVVMVMRWPGGQTAGLATSDNSGRVELAETRYDWGEIPIDGGNKEKTFGLKNVGQGVLEIGSLATSCMCTTVTVKTKLGESPVFGMHDNSAWKGKVEVGETAEIKVIFDPAYHGPTGKGVVTRVVKFETNDPAKRQVELWLTGKVI